MERLSQQNRMIKIALMQDQDTGEFSQFTEPVVCREYTLPRDEKSSDKKRLDPSEHQNWTRLGSHNQLPTR